MEVPASTGGLDSSGAINRGRAFDFNVFPAELFSRIDINKSMVASIEEGGVGGAVQMYTAGGLDSPASQASVLIQTGYNDLSEETDPRFTATYTTANKAKTVGFMISAAQMERNSWQDGFGTVRWQRPDASFRGNETTLSNQQLQSLWYPRLPRQDSFRHDQERTGPGELAPVPPERPAGHRLESGALEVRGNDDQLQLLRSVPSSRHLGLQQHHPDQRHRGPGRQRTGCRCRHLQGRVAADGEPRDRRHDDLQSADGRLRVRHQRQPDPHRHGRPCHVRVRGPPLPRQHRDHGSQHRSSRTTSRGIPTWP